MQIPRPLARLQSIAHVERSGARWSFEIAGVTAWYCEFSQGICVGIKVDSGSIDDEWLERASLWLASLRDAIDDAFVIDSERLWLVRRYPPKLPDAEWGPLINQQACIANWLASRCNGSDARDHVGGIEAWG